MVGWYAFGTSIKIPGITSTKTNTGLDGQTTQTGQTTELTQTPKYEFTEEKVTGIPETDGTEKGGVVSDSNIKNSKITYTDNGFEPFTITIKINTNVTFTNKSNGMMWIASNPHPAHTDLPGFDQKNSIGKGGLYTYTFSKIGTWKYHNHNAPEKTGVVIVTK